MNYREYLSYRAEMKAIHGESLLDAGDLDLYGKFPAVAKVDGLPGHKNGNIHRCHLVEDFLSFYGLDVDKRLIGFSEGVRASLTVLFELYAERSWLIPSDNYPFYLEAAAAADVSFATLDTLEEGSLTALGAFEGNSDTLLLTYPLKPSGRRYNPADVDILRSWLAADAERIVIIDAVYVFDLSEERELLELFAGNEQVVILYSLSKAFAAPRVAGFTFTHRSDIREAFKGLARDDEKMELCYGLLNSDYGRNRAKEVRDFIAEQKHRAEVLGLVTSDTDEGYLFHLGAHPDEMLAYDTLVVPASVYGSDSDGCIISTLSLTV